MPFGHGIRLGRASEAELEQRKAQRRATAKAEEGVGHQRGELRILAMDIVLDDDLHAEPHVDDRSTMNSEHEDGDERLSRASRTTVGVGSPAQVR